MFCKHDWETITDKIMGGFDGDIQAGGIGSLKRLLKRTHVCIVKCKKCGKLKKFVTTHNTD